MRSKHGKGKKMSAYFTCVEKGCPARAVTTGGPDPNLIQLKYHNKAPNTHNHPSDEVANLLTKLRADFAERARLDLSATPKSLYDKLAEENLCSLSGPLREEFLRRLPPFSKHKNMFYNIWRNFKEPRNYCKTSPVDNFD